MTFVDSTDNDDPFLLDLEASDAETARAGLLHMCASQRAAPNRRARSRLLEDLHPDQRFARFEHAIAKLLCVSDAVAAAMLARIDDASAWQEQAPGIALLPLTAGPDAGYALSAFLRVHAGVVFPQHEHLGEELTYVLQGAFEEDSLGLRFGPGEPARMPAGSRHGFRVPADGPHLVGLVTLRAGFRLL